MLKRITGLSFILFMLVGYASGQDVTTMLKDAQTLIDNAKEPEALAKYLELLKVSPDNYVATWNASLLYSKVGNRLTDEDKQKTYFTTAKQYALKALQLDSNDAESNYVMAVAMGRMALISGPHDKVAAAREIKRYDEKALNFNPNHADAWYVLGLWNYDVANLNFLERAAAKMLFGGLSEGTVAHAITYYKYAISLNPTYILYWKDLAVAYDNDGQTANAIDAAKKAISFPVKTADDPQNVKEAQDLLKKLQ